MSYVCKRGYKCMCFQCGEKDCEYFESEPPEWVKDILENEEKKEKLKRISDPMSDLISKQAAIDALGEEPMVWCNENEYELGERNQWNSDVLAIKAVPSAQPETIRCKGCNQYDSHGHRCKHWNHGVNPTDWCSHAERKTDE